MNETERVQAFRRVLESLGERDEGKSWQWIENRCDEMAKENEYLKAKRDYLLNEIRHLNEADERWIEGNCGTCPTVKRLMRYAKHAEECGVNAPHGSYRYAQGCDCGLTAVIDRLDDMKEEK